MTGDRLRMTDQIPAAQRMSCVLKSRGSGKGLFRVFTTPPRFLFRGDIDTRRILKSRRQHRSHFEHRCYRGLTTVTADRSPTGCDGSIAASSESDWKCSPWYWASFRDGAQHQTRNLEILRCASAHRSSMLRIAPERLSPCFAGCIPSQTLRMRSKMLKQNNLMPARA